MKKQPNSQTLRIALIGYGKMGHAIEQAAAQQKIDVVARIDPHVREAEWDHISSKSLANVDVCLDFTHPDTVLQNLKQVAPLGIPLVIGTTGWEHHLEQVDALIKDNNIGLIHAQNFSLGMFLFTEMVREAAALVNRLGHYDVALHEIHHRQKVDSPSGTARALAEVLLEKMETKKKVVAGNVPVDSEALHVSSLRVGTVPGTHSVVFDSDRDTITLTHQAHERTGWAQGALEAAAWIRDKKGRFDFKALWEGS